MSDTYLPTADTCRQYKKMINRIGMMLSIMFALMYILPIPMNYLNLIRPASHGWQVALDMIRGFLSAVSYISYFVIPVFFFYGVINRRNRVERIRFEVRLPAVSPLLILAGLAVLTSAAYVNALFCDLIGFRLPDEWMGAVDYDNAAAIIQYMSVALAPAIAEEIMFRGVIYGNLRPFGRTQAMLISSLLFALMHQNVGQFFYTFVGGVAMAVMYEVTGSIWCSTLFHMINNEISVIQGILVGRYGDDVSFILTVMETVTLFLGFLSILFLLRHARKRRDEAESERENGIFGKNMEENSFFFRKGRAIPFHTAVRYMNAPWMIVFTVVAFGSAIMVYMAVAYSGMADRIAESTAAFLIRAGSSMIRPAALMAKGLFL